MLLSLILLFTILSCQTTCEIPPVTVGIPSSMVGRVGLASDVTTCLRKINGLFTDEELNSFITTFTTFTESHPFHLRFLDAPSGFPSVDLVSELNVLKAKIGTLGFGAYELFEGISDIYKKLHDCHAVITFPILRNFIYLLPLEIFTQIKDDKVIFITPLDPENNMYAELTEMDLTGTGLLYLPVEEAISILALEEINDHGYDPHAQFNTLFGPSYKIPGLGFIFPAVSMFSPELKYGPEILWKGVEPTLGQISGKVSWMAISGPGLSVNLADLLSRKATSEKQQFVLANNTKPDIKDLLRNMRLDATSHFRLTSDTLPLKSIPPPSVVSHATPAAESINTTLKMPPSRTAQAAKPNVETLAFDLSNDVLFSHNSTALEEASPSAATSLILTDTANKIGYVRLTTFDPVDDLMGTGKPAELASFYVGFGRAYRAMVDRGVKDVIIDMRQNGGGSLAVMETWLDFFFHDTLYPTVMVGDWMKSTLAGETSKFFQSMITPRIFDPDTGYLVTDFYGEGNVTKEHVNTVTNPPTLKTATYTKKYAFDHSMTPAGLSAAYGGYSPFTPDHVYIVTDGVCASCCGMFTKTAQEVKAARVVGFGYNPVFKGKYETYAPGSSSGMILDSDMLEALGGMLGMDMTKMPHFEFTNVSMRWTHFEFYSRNPSHSDESIYFVNTTVQEVFPLGVGDDGSGYKKVSDVLEIANTLYNKYMTQPSNCYAHEVKVADACATAERTANHQLWGRPCAEGYKFSTVLCKFAFCVPGYYLSGINASTDSGICLPIPVVRANPGPGPEPEKNNKSEGGAQTGLLVAVIVLAVLLVAALGAVAFLVVYFTVIRKNKGSGDGSSPQELMNDSESGSGAGTGSSVNSAAYADEGGDIPPAPPV